MARKVKKDPAGNNTAPDTSADAIEKLALNAQDKKFRLVMKNTRDGILLVQNDTIKECNRGIAQMSGYRLEELVDTCFASYFHPDDISAVEAMGRRPRQNPAAVQELEATLMRKDGAQLTVEIISVPCAFQQQPAGLVMIRDISDRIKAKKEIERTGKLDSIAALAGGIAHDYNNLLTAIIGNITLAQTHLDRQGKPFLLLSQALEASKTAKNLTQKLITFSRGGAPNKEITAADRLLKSAVEFTLSGSNIKPEFKFSPELWPVEVDPSQIGQAIHNIVINAREAMPDGGILSVIAKNEVLDDALPNLKSGKYIRISIADQGSGIAAAEFEKIFDPYYSTKTFQGQKGTGLGLSISHSIIRKHGGDVMVESQIGVGTTLHVYLPAADENSAAAKPGQPAGNQQPIFGEEKILVMDDEEMIRNLAGEILRHLGYEVDFAKDGAEAVKRYQAAMNSGKLFDAVILDLTVRGGMGAKETIQELRAIDPGVKGIVSSGYSDDPGMIDFKTYGFSGVIVKPYTLEELGEKLSRVLRS